MANVKQDMGTGSVKKLMVQMAVPALVGQVVNLLYNIVDRIYIGHLPEVGGNALTGVWLVYADPDADHCLCNAGRCRRRAPRSHCHGSGK